MKANTIKASLIKSLAASILLLSSGVCLAQSAVTLTAMPQSATLPDGQVVPMWGYTCSSPSGTGVSCTAMNGSAQTGGAVWQPPLVTVPGGQPLTITLANMLSFNGGANAVPTSLVIVGQLGGGLGDLTQRTTMPSPAHAPQGTTWPGTLGGIDPATAAITVGVPGAGYRNPPAVTISGGGGSGATAVATIANGVVTGVNVSSVGSGYTSAPTVTIAVPSCTINGTTCVRATATMSFTILQSSDGSATFVPPAQADRVRSFGTEVAAGASASLVWNNLHPGTYLIESGTQPSIQGPMGLYGVLVVTDPLATPTAPQAYGTLFDKDVALLFSEIDPMQNSAVDLAVGTSGFSDALVWNGQSGRCGDPTVHTCYPPAVNYSPRYYLINGVSFDATSPAASTQSILAPAPSGSVLLRFVNAGLHIHVPSVVGARMSLIAEDGNKLPGMPKVQSEVLLVAGKTYDVTIQPTQAVPATSPVTYAPATYPVFDRALGLSTNNNLNGGMQAYLQVAGGAPSGVGSGATAALSGQGGVRNFYCTVGTPLTISDPSMGLLAGVTGANGVALGSTFTGNVSAANVSVQSNGTFSYTPPASACDGSFTYSVNNTGAYVATISDCAGNPTCAGTVPTAGPGSYTSNFASRLQVSPPGVLSFVTNPSAYALTAIPGSVASTCASVTINADGSFTATPSAPAPSSCTFTYQASTATKRTSGNGTVTVNFLAASGLAVNVYDAPSTKAGQTKVAITDYRWIIEEDRTFWVDPKCQTNNPGNDPATQQPYRDPSCPPLPVESLAYSFHTANMPVVAQGCVGTISCEAGQTLQGEDATCDIGNGACRAKADPSGLGILVDTSAGQKSPLDPKDVHLDPNKRYFISILPGDGVNTTIGGAGGPNDDGTPFSIAKNCGTFNPSDPRWAPGGADSLCGHGMGGAQIAKGQTAVNIALQQSPLPTAKLSAFVFQDDYPLNGENDAGGGVDIIAPNEAGLGGFEIKLFDQAGGLGDNTGQPTYDEFNQPLTNSLAGQIDPITGLDACPITKRTDRLVGMIPTCPKYESDGVTLSPLVGQVIIENLYPGIYEIQAYPAADRIARGEEWLQTNTLDGGAPHEAFIKPNEPGYFQEFGPGNFHVSIGFANPQIINSRKAQICAGQACTSKLTVNVSNTHMSRTPDQRTYSSGNYDHYAFTQCYVSVGIPDALDFAFGKCDPDGQVVFEGMPAGTYKIAVLDQWNDIMLDGLVSSVTINGDTMKSLPVFQWRSNIATRTYIDANGNGIPDRDADANDLEAGLALVNTNIRYRDGSFGFFNNTDLNGYAGFNEVFPFMNWLVVETTSTRFKPTGVHTVYDAGGPTDGTVGGGNSTIARFMANTIERVPLPSNLRVPGAVYCAGADCLANNLTTGNAAGGPGGSSGAVMPPQPWGVSQGWQGLLGQDNFIEFGMKPFAETENGGIHGHVIYASTRPFDDPALSLQLSWEPGVPRVTINLYSKTVDQFGHEKLTLVDHTTTTSWDDWAQGFRKDAAGNLMTDGAGHYIPNMNCPGQDPTSPFFATLKGSTQWLDDPSSHAGAVTPRADGKLPLASNSQFKCYDGWSQLNQIQPAPYDGMYSFPSVNTVNPANGKPASSNCTICTPNPDTTDPFRAGTPMLPPGKYVVEVIVPQGYELVKEEDKNILLGDVFIAPVTQQFAGFGNIFIMPDQAAVNAYYNANNPGSLNLTTNLGATPRHEGDTGSVETFWPCVGAKRIVPDLNSLFPGAGQAAPFAGAKRSLCDRKEVTLDDQMTALAKFYIFSSTHIAGHFTGTMTNDFASEFDPFSPQFGEKFSPPNLPVGMRDFNGNEVARVYADQWGIFNGLYFSSWSVNPPNPTGYAPQMSISCMNDPGPIARTNATGQYVNASGTVVATADLADQITDPAYSPAYSNFCYEMPFMPGFTAYMDTPVIPTMAFADGYNLPDTEYPDHTPAIMKVVNSNASVPQGPWVTQGVGATAATRATVSFTISGTGQCSNSTCGGNPATVTFPNGVVTCKNTTSTAGPNCSSGTVGTRNNNVAAYIRSNIAALVGAGYTASGTNASVTVNAPSTGASYNGTAVVTATHNVTVNTGVPTQLAGGADAAPAIPTAMGITITALGDKVVQNPNFAGPNSTTAPFNQKTITRHYGFGTTAGTVVLVDAAGVSYPLTGVTWSDTTITGTVPSTLPLCNVSNSSYVGANASARCGQIVITAADGKRSIDAITVTFGGTTPWIVTPAGVTAPGGKSVADYGAKFGRMGASPIQTALDSAAAGDLILVTPGTYRENLIMWKPVRLQGVGASSVTINADAHPAGKMDQWRRQVNCAFGLDLDGIPNMNNSSFDAGGTYSCPSAMHNRVDRIQFEAITGWDASGNGNLAQLLQEPTLMGAYEGAGITVLGRGVKIPVNSTDFWGNDPAAAGAFTAGAVYIGTGDCSTASTTRVDSRDYGTANFYCNPSRIDGVSVINSSQGGGGVFIHGWAQRLEVSNNRIWGNHGTLAGGINLGNGETPSVYLNDGTICGAGAATTDTCPPFGIGTFAGIVLPNGAIPFQWNTSVRIHHNMIYNNAGIGDALFTGTPAGAGGITVSAGADGYRIDHNWIAGNLSTGDGGGLQHLGVSFNPNISNNYILFNQSTNPTLPTNGGGIVIEGANEPRMLNGTECGGTTDQDCPPGLGEGTGPGLVIDANLILGNSAESGSGGGLRLSQINGTEVVNFPLVNPLWYGVSVTNNIIANNVAGWDGGGVSLQDALKVSFVNNTVAANDATASSGALFKTLGAINAAAPPSGCSPVTDPDAPQDPGCLGDNAPHGPQPAGLVTMRHTPNLLTALAPADVPTVLCPSPILASPNFGYSGILNGDCRLLSKPAMVNNLFWQNRSFSVNIVDGNGNVVNGNVPIPTGTGLQSQQNLIRLTPTLVQASTGDCTATGTNAATFYWDIGLRTDDVSAGLLSTSNNKLALSNSILTNDQQGVIASMATNRTTNPTFVAPYCNGARIPPENCAAQNGQTTIASCQGYNTPVGASETTNTALLFQLTGIQATATVDEGHNWLNLSYGPLSLGRPNVIVATAGEMMVGAVTPGLAQGAYSIPGTSPAANGGLASVAPNHDFFGSPRGSTISVGAVQVVATAPPPPPPTTIPTLTVLDNFNRTNANTLGGNWQQLVTLSNSGIRVNGNQAFCINTGPSAALCAISANGYWNGTGAVFGSQQAAAFTFANTTLNNTGVYLKATGTLTLGAYPSAIRVRYSTASGGQVIVETTSNGGLSFTPVATLAGSFASGNTLTALADAAGTVYVWKTSGATTTLIGSAVTGIAGGGRIGLSLPSGGRVDDFAGGTVP